MPRKAEKLPRVSEKPFYWQPRQLRPHCTRQQRQRRSKGADFCPGQMIAETIMHNTSVHASAASRSALAQHSAASAGRCVSA